MRPSNSHFQSCTTTILASAPTSSNTLRGTKPPAPIAPGSLAVRQRTQLLRRDRTGRHGRRRSGTWSSGQRRRGARRPGDRRRRPRGDVVVTRARTLHAWRLSVESPKVEKRTADQHAQSAPTCSIFSRWKCSISISSSANTRQRWPAAASRHHREEGRDDAQPRRDEANGRPTSNAEASSSCDNNLHARM
jgi:hypothetical protein